MFNIIGELLEQEGVGFLQFGGARMALLDIESGFWSIRRQLEALLGGGVTNSVLQQAGANGGASFASSFFSDQVNERPAGFQACLLAYQTAGFGRFEIKTMEWPLGRLIIQAHDSFEAWMTRQHQQQVDSPVCAYTAGVLVGFINVISDRQDVVCIERSCQAQGAEVCEFESLPADKVGDQEQVVTFNPDPGLSRQINLLEMLFDRMPMGVAVIDRDFILRRYNPTWAAFMDKYTPSTSVDVAPGRNIFDLEPGTEDIIIPLFNRVLDGETVRQDAVRIESGGIVSYRDIVLSPLYENEHVVGLLNVSTDATERVKAEESLKETLGRLEENESMLRSVVENAQHFAIYRLQVDLSNPYLGKVVLVSPSLQELVGIEDPYHFESWFENLHPDDYPRIVEANRRSLEEGIAYNQLARFFNVQQNRWRWLHTISNPGFDAQGMLTHFDGMVVDLTDKKEAELALQESQRKLSTLISNLPGMAYRCRNDRDWTMEFVSEGSLELTGYRPEELIANKKVSYGALIHPEDQATVWNQVQTALSEGRPFKMTYRIETPAREKWVWEQGQGVSNADGEIIALEGFITDITERVMAQQNLEQRVDERTYELTTLLDISHDLASTLDLKPLLDLILDQLRAVVEYDAASIMILDEDMLKILAYRGPIAREEALQIRFSAETAKANQQVIKRREPVIIEDIRGKGALARAIRETAGDELETTYSYLRCWMGVPLIIKDQVVGMLTLDHQQPGYYASTQAKLAMAFASQAAVAIENARLYTETRQRAEEIQTLFAVQQAITSRLELESVLQMIADESCRLTSAHRAAVFLLEGEIARLTVESGEETGFQTTGSVIPLQGSLIEEAIKVHRTIWISDAEQDGRVQNDPQRKALINRIHARSMMIVPLVIGGRPVGALSITDDKAGSFNVDDERIMTLLASSAVVGMENARLYEQEQVRQRELQVLLDVTAAANSSLELDETLATSLDRLVEVLEVSRAGVMLLDEPKGELVAQMIRPERSIVPGDLEQILKACQTVVDSGEPLFVTPDAARGFIEPGALLPLHVRGKTLGVLVIIGPEGETFTARQLALFKSIVDQLSVALENARLYEQAEQAATVHERNRLARDLHDAVSQTLFSASLIADVLPKLWQRNPDMGQQKLEELRLLTRGALSEMRTLLFELRPDMLGDMDLADLYRHLTNAFTGRTRIPVIYTQEGQSELQLDVKEAFYRIAQEALNNISKHTEASRVQVQLIQNDDRVEVIIQDNGCGFDPAALSPENMGLKIMRERAEAVRAKVDIQSTVGGGTRIQVRWHTREENT